MSTKEQQEAATAIYIYSTIKQFCQRHPAFAEGGIRHNIFYEQTNELAESGAIIRNDRRVLIKEERFFYWLESKKHGAVA